MPPQWCTLKPPQSVLHSLGKDKSSLVMALSSQGVGPGTNQCSVSVEWDSSWSSKGVGPGTNQWSVSQIVDH